MFVSRRRIAMTIQRYSDETIQPQTGVYIEMLERNLSYLQTDIDRALLDTYDQFVQLKRLFKERRLLQHVLATLKRQEKRYA